ncbi:hypothetical protein M431DRAFT_203539 [Trichoderma harzianum CBS 226.95]|uniref:Uncharacterized protein n=1 Tax=Trichoderma harzianum CBS 226.95 TaxID=983964 RepID=A0A2T4AVL8_TRIHA|nr:hypothetical protein M431DRAFT_203539 [Trichoderma harzianum CBS 226.95]PTB61091.1 hypothetical protein M431DRAFT_203539 [Trichoderma harzianum CBS 226.95]
MRTPPSPPSSGFCTPFLPQPARRASLVRQVHVLVTCTNLARCAHPQVPLHSGAGTCGTCGPGGARQWSCQLSHRPCFSTLPPFSLLSSACVQFPLRQLGPMGAVRKGKPTISSFHALLMLGNRLLAALVPPLKSTPGSHSLLFRLRRSAVSRCNSR